MRQTSVTPSQAAALADGYNAGATIAELAEDAGLHRQTVIRHLVRAGIELPRHGLTDEQARAAAELYVDGLTLVEVGARLGVSEGTIRTCLRRQGVARRPAGRRRAAAS
jgi:DNA-binding transcriptional regulator LsrR (DeoR family)